MSTEKGIFGFICNRGIDKERSRCFGNGLIEMLALGRMFNIKTANMQLLVF